MYNLSTLKDMWKCRLYLYFFLSFIITIMVLINNIATVPQYTYIAKIAYSGAMVFFFLTVFSSYLGYMIPFKKSSFNQTFKRKTIDIKHNTEENFYKVTYKFYNINSVIVKKYNTINECEMSFKEITLSGILYKNFLKKLIIDYKIDSH